MKKYDEENKPLLSGRIQQAEHKPLLSGRIQQADKQYRDFHDALNDYHDAKSFLVHTINDEAEPLWTEFVLGFFLWWVFPFFRANVDSHPHHDASQLEYYQHVYHTFKGSDVTLNVYNYGPLLYSNGIASKAFKACIALLMQILLTTCISVGLFRQDNPDPDGVWADISDVEVNIVVIAVVSSFLLIFSVRDQFRTALISSRFYAWYPEIYGDSWFMFLLESWSNMGLSLYLFFLNAVVILISENAIDAVLNSVAIFFIAEVDEYLIPDYSSDDTVEHQFVMQLFRHYCARSREVGVEFDRVEDKVDDHEGMLFRKMG
uniref:Uncharacterized protein n=1 Tax=Paramoeba aestuarina TaxID=180227 RepID=A0A7S4U7A8_9EUKA|mmetsp:Transcript_40011/g.63239  ORF Transcript_40011/g.63239 Transcript_40011/m.63239 type:complete len:318 (+) Transcript_40011:68-1021(+)|eukprot:CAMPEP_0201512806 /NCGR_PEP_ID=MMETSP0161_2-20130828/4990_1 /ASSEMBLY_ACC=CAM_ASM_000251 /TAXON_ID=180227 /ORGANISM="Neoparamoeba aestuarina, Strain SoJaBio B1-5/56/2" /LENGTH=317 /DNA_ID=CAMNT_0047908787 /DNA_START=72 /DNA_END=1025 /DNA_ORIENTATION=+